MTSSTKIVDRPHRIVEIVWDPKATPDDFDRITRQIEGFSRELGGVFDVIVDMRTVKAFLPESQAKLVEHQKALLQCGMRRAAVIVAGAITKIQLNRTAKQSEHTTESHWDNYEDALQFLKS
ncbi:hypothetical protein B5M42_014865 [Paenibacillus athensensis]|uniref:STAS/SEC14 domain-containing protein n=1 Tax=Paenibacillus athensensis TaxID=1967502 RepID=A0A4Y8Q8R1_9BACL|nr:hypothetical protein [Paenibacillus athensensis]MCD1260094.1 hypothetical protein [Paenibacillus athensensis]